MGRPQWRPRLNGLIAVALAIVVLTAVLKVAFRGRMPWIGDSGFVVAPALILVAALRLLVRREWRQGTYAVLVLIPFVLFASLMVWVVSDGLARMRQPRQWHRAETQLPQGLGSLSLAMQSLAPKSILPVPGPHRKTWHIEYRPAQGESRTIPLPDRTMGLEMTVALAGTEQQPVLHLSYPPDGSADSVATDIYLDVWSGASVEPVPGPERVLGRFDMMDLDGPMFIPHYDRPSADGQVVGMTALAVAPGGSVYAADDRAGIVIHYGADGRFLSKWPLAGGHFVSGLAVDPAGDVWVLGYGEHALQRYTPGGKLVAEYRAPLEVPAGLAIGAEGRLSVVGMDGLVYRLAADGTRLASWEETDSRPGRIIFCGVAAMPTGEVVVTDRGSDRVRVYSAEGKLLRKWRVGNGGFLSHTTPLSVAADEGGRMVVVVWTDGDLSVEEYRIDGTRLRRWPVGLSGRDRSPVPLAVSDRYVWVGDRNGGRILRFTRTGTPTPDWGSKSGRK